MLVWHYLPRFLAPTECWLWLSIVTYLLAEALVRSLSPDVFTDVVLGDCADLVCVGNRECRHLAMPEDCWSTWGYPSD